MDLFDFLLLGIALINLIACPIVAVCLAVSARQNRALQERNAAQAAMIGRLEWRIKNPQQAADQDFVAGTQWERETREFEPAAPLEINRVEPVKRADFWDDVRFPIRPVTTLDYEHASIADNYSGHRVGEVRGDCPKCTRNGAGNSSPDVWDIDPLTGPWGRRDG